VRTVEAVLQDIRANACAELPPSRERSLEPEFLDVADRTVECRPHHDLGVREVALLTARLPDAVVGLAPRFLEELEDLHFEAPVLVAPLEPGVPRERQRIDELAVHVELQLHRSGVAHTHRLRR
jgi:hypothetical protein